MRRCRGDKDDSDKLVGLLRLAQIVSFLVVFVAGVVIGLTTSSHINRHFNSHTDVYTLINRVSNSIPGVKEENCTIVQGCEVDCFSVERFLNPNQKNLTHSLSDDELFWRASFVPIKREHPYHRVPKVAFMFLTRGPLPMLPLWERFFKGHEDLFSIYVHAPPGYKLNVTNSSVFYARHIPSQAVSWGTVSLADAERRLLANALLDFSNERFVLLSESCIPVYNFPTVYKYLTESDYSFVESYDDPSRYGRGRYSRRMLPDIQLKQWRKGSQWFELNRDLAVYIVSDTKYYNLFRKYCKPACYPDEHYIPTFLNMFYSELNSNRTVTWVDWSMGGPHPATYGEADITDSFIQSIRNNGTLCPYNSGITSVCYLFARKFAPSALEPLLKLSSTVMEF
ncbi:Core-2/I-branching beta-1,6-N-acetylglucosaminyltransferase family protein [Quillaja saponaria]|uniref:Core-2/I-branching beta-1,6-N-acetylglucosaminyltransferase family protein n=1 Tax=Quillaja saponaria TaxID=32244 RepID=A0AAD7PV33_QUISA|nr:Core-2/I-branching beta-1,6-N-acetylglucosaminyltransferase family protein [Quillaja saponaria]